MATVTIYKPKSLVVQSTKRRVVCMYWGMENQELGGGRNVERSVIGVSWEVKAILGGGSVCHGLRPRGDKAYYYIVVTALFTTTCTTYLTMLSIIFTVITMPSEITNILSRRISTCVATNYCDRQISDTDRHRSSSNSIILLFQRSHLVILDRLFSGN